jgi:phage repressor protein C with HTH and peptisase S24 domain
MIPTYRPGQIVVGVAPTREIRVGDIIMLHHDGLEKIKRVAQLDATQRMYVLGDNPLTSTDSRVFGWVEGKSVRAKIIWPRTRRVSDYSVGGR